MVKSKLLIAFFLLFSAWTGNVHAQCFQLLGAPRLNWYKDTFYLLHFDHHPQSNWEVGRDSDPEAAAWQIGLSNPDVLQISSKGAPGWTTYPSEVGYTSSSLQKDLLQICKDIADDYGYRFSVYYNIGRDGMSTNTHPEYIRVRADGSLTDGTFCYLSDAATNYLYPMIEEIVTKYQPDGFWLDNSCGPVEPCYCERCQARFFAEQGLAAPRTSSEEGWDEYRDMTRQIYREFAQDTVSFIRSISPDCMIAFNHAWGFNMPETPCADADYLTFDIANNVEEIQKEACFADSQGLPFDIMPAVWYSNYGTHELKPSVQVEQEMAVTIANGGRFFMWNNLERFGSRFIEERAVFLGEVVAPFLRARQELCLNSVRLPDVSMFHGAATHYTQTRLQDGEFSGLDLPIMAVDSVLRELHLNHEMITDDRLEQQDIRGQLFVVETQESLSESNIASIQDYVEQGGTLLITGPGAIHSNLLDAVGVELVRELCPLVLNVNAGETNWVFTNMFARVAADEATVLLSAEAAGGEYPLLTCNTVGSGHVYAFYCTTLFRQTPKELADIVLQMILPEDDRLVATDATSDTEIILREKDGRKIVHLVNIAEGTREIRTTETSGWLLTLGTYISALPQVEPCTVSVKVSDKPDSVMLEPQGIELAELTDWEYQDGRLTVQVPEFDVHQMVSIKCSTTAGWVVGFGPQQFFRYYSVSNGLSNAGDYIIGETGTNARPYTAFSDIIMGEDGYLYHSVVESNRATIGVYDITRAGADSYVGNFYQGADGSVGAVSFGFATNSSGTLFSAIGGAVWQYSAAGTGSNYASTPGSVGTFSKLKGITFDQDDNLYVCSYGNGNVYKCTANGDWSVFYTSADTSDSVFDIDVSSDGQTFYLIDRGVGEVVELDAEGNRLGTLLSGTPNSYGYAAVAGNGTLYVPSQTESTVYEIETDGIVTAHRVYGGASSVMIVKANTGSSD